MRIKRHDLARSVLRPFAILAISLLTVLFQIEPAQGQPDYTSIDVGSLQNETTEVNGINDSNQVSGTSYGYWPGEGAPVNWHVHPFRWTDGVMTDFFHEVPGCTGALAMGINDLGDMVGATIWVPPEPGTYLKQPAMWFGDGVIVELGSLGGEMNELTKAWDVNNNRQVVGQSMTAGEQLHAFVWEDNVMTDLGIFPTGDKSVTYDINQAGVIVGWAQDLVPYQHHRVVTWEHNGLGWEMTDHGFPGIGWDPSNPGEVGSWYAEGLAINEAGTIVGWGYTPSNSQYPFMYRDGEWTNPGTPLGFSNAYPWAINNHDVAVGWGYHTTEGNRAFIWTAEGIYDLNDLVIDAPSFVFTAAEDINDLGCIAANAYHISNPAKSHGFMLVPENMPQVAEQDGMPPRFYLRPTFPNPFYPTTTISYELPASSPVSLTVHEVTGKLVRTLEGGIVQEAGLHRIMWDRRDDSGNEVGSGVYLYRVRACEFSATGRMTLVR